MDICAWLKALGLNQYETAFGENAIDGAVLLELSDADLEKLGVRSLGHRKKLLKAIETLRVRQHDGPAERDHCPLPPSEGERRQVTVLFVDLVGYTTLTRTLDAEEVHAVLDRFFTLSDTAIESHGGRIDKHIGDCVMGVFGAPIAFGNDAERAVRTALAIRDAMPGLAAETGQAISIHIGIAGGQVIASGTGSASHREYTVTGESVNLASRLTDAAPASEILLSEAVQLAVASKFDLADAGALSVKGFAEPIRAWRLLGAKEEKSESRPFVGRNVEIRQFQAVLANCRANRHGSVVCVRGEAGIGKSRLVEEWRRLALEAGFSCHRAAVLDFGTGSERDPIRTLVCSLLGMTVKAPAEAGSTDDLLVTGEQAVFLNDLLDLPQPPELRRLYDAMDNESRNRGKRQLIVQIARRLSQIKPQLLVLEDIHWADPTVLAYAAELTAAAADCQTLLVMTSRFEGDPLDREWQARAGLRPVTTVDLGPLRPQESRMLAEAVLETHGSDIDRCVERAAGNPLFLEQLLRHVDESRDHDVPGSVLNLVQARLDRLKPGDKAALQAASVFGQHFDGDALEFLLGESGDATRRLVQHLLIRPQDGGSFVFAHALVRDAVYDTLLKNRRRSLHRRAAEWFSSRDQILHAEHLERADDPEASNAYLSAARVQTAEYRYELALRLIDKGLTLTGNAGCHFELACYRAQLLNDLGLTSEALAAFGKALEVARDDADRCRAWIGLAEVKRIVDDLDGASKALDLAEEVATRLGLIAEAARIHFLRGNLLFPKGDLEGCLHEHSAALARAQLAGHPELEAAALGGLGDAEYIRGRIRTSHEHFSRCVAMCQRHGLGRIEVANRSMVGVTRWLTQGPRRGLDEALAAVGAAAKVGHRRGEVIAHHAAYFCRYDLADFSSAWDNVRRALTLAQQLGARRFEAEALAFRGMLHAATAQRASAITDLQDALAIFRETGMAYLGPAVLGMLAFTTEDPKIREAVLAEGDALLSVGSICHNHFLFRRFAIDACIESADWDGVERHAAALEEFVRPEPLPWTDFFVGRARALAAHRRTRGGASFAGELFRLRELGQSLGFVIALPAIEKALRQSANG